MAPFRWILATLVYVAYMLTVTATVAVLALILHALVA